MERPRLRALASSSPATVRGLSSSASSGTQTASLTDRAVASEKSFCTSEPLAQMKTERRYSCWNRASTTEADPAKKLTIMPHKSRVTGEKPWREASIPTSASAAKPPASPATSRCHMASAGTSSVAAMMPSCAPERRPRVAGSASGFFSTC